MLKWCVLLLLVVTIPFVAACPPEPVTPLPCRSDAMVDDLEETMETGPMGGVDACEKAGRRLKDLGCKESRPDFSAACRKLIANKIPICPVKLSKIKSCAEVEHVCR